jgi:hypothetical protein
VCDYLWTGVVVMIAEGANENLEERMSYIDVSPSAVSEEDRMSAALTTGTALRLRKQHLRGNNKRKAAFSTPQRGLILLSILTVRVVGRQ